MDVGSFSLFVISNTKTATVRSRIMDMVTQKIAERLYFILRKFLISSIEACSEIMSVLLFTLKQMCRYCIMIVGIVSNNKSPLAAVNRYFDPLGILQFLHLLR